MMDAKPDSSLGLTDLVGAGDRPGARRALFGSFAEASGLNAEMETEEYREGGKNTGPHKFVKWGKYPNLVFKRGVTLNTDIWDWYYAVALQAQEPGPQERHRRSSPTAAAASAPLAGGPTSLGLPGLDQLPVAIWFFRNALPEKLQGPSSTPRATRSPSRRSSSRTRGSIAWGRLMIPGVGDALATRRAVGGAGGISQHATLRTFRRPIRRRSRSSSTRPSTASTAASSYAELQVPGLRTPLLQFVRGEAQTLSLELFLDGTDKRGSSPDEVKERLEQIRGSSSTIDEHLHAPPVCLFQWKDVSFQGVVTSLKEKYTLFDESGRVLRARVTLCLKSYEAVEVQLAR